ncbi:MAG: hypothetical protein LBC03_04630 [Nitrososphaerota archaeon]|jgi:hypothetical protein|nr:hypothetical protein [Nitrososphaerota archaeon]
MPHLWSYGTTSNKRKQPIIQHYIGFQEGKRLYSYHHLEVNGSKTMEATKPAKGNNKKLVEPSAGFGAMSMEPFPQNHILILRVHAKH